MSMQDPIADMLTRIRNAQQARHNEVSMAHSNQKEAIAKVLNEEGYVGSYRTELENDFKKLVIELKYYQNSPVIERVKKISRPGYRVYKSAKELKSVSGFGIIILSTSNGIMSHITAKSKNIGGEVIGEVA